MYLLKYHAIVLLGYYTGVLKSAKTNLVLNALVNCAEVVQLKKYCSIFNCAKVELLQVYFKCFAFKDWYYSYNSHQKWH